jgi:hypothetical protein
MHAFMLLCGAAKGLPSLVGFGLQLSEGHISYAAAVLGFNAGYSPEPPPVIGRPAAAEVSSRFQVRSDERQGSPSIAVPHIVFPAETAYN